MRRNIVLSGVGGQGTVLASRLIATAAMKKGLPVMSAETIGMAQRGGSVFSHLRIGAGVHSPMIEQGTADLIIGFEPAETVRMLSYLAPEGRVVVCSQGVAPVTASLAEKPYEPELMLSYLKSQLAERLLVVDAKAALKELGSFKVLNVLLLGAAVYSGALGFSEEELLAAIREKLPEKLQALNSAALLYVKNHSQAE
jgi:indolepyruvate ferredoxin oxidoreductase beta subunit